MTDETRERRSSTPWPVTAGKRARDADRERAIGVLREAYADGQLTFEEFDARMAEASSARRLHQLSTLTDDLQGVDHGLGSATVPAPRAYRPTRPPGAAIAAGLVLVAVALVVTVLAMRSAGDGAASAEAQQVGVPASPALVVRRPVDGPDLGAAPAWSQAQEQLPPQLEAGSYTSPVGRWASDVVASLDWLEQLPRLSGSYFVRKVSVYPEFGAATVAAHGARPGVQGIELRDDTVRIGAEEWTGDRDTVVVDLRHVDRARLRANLEHALHDLGVPDATLTYILIEAPDLVSGDRPRISFFVGNEFEESAYLATTLGGRIISESPFA